MQLCIVKWLQESLDLFGKKRVDVPSHFKGVNITITHGKTQQFSASGHKIK